MVGLVERVLQPFPPVRPCILNFENPAPLLHLLPTSKLWHWSFPSAQCAPSHSSIGDPGAHTQIHSHSVRKVLSQQHVFLRAQRCAARRLETIWTHSKGQS